MSARRSLIVFGMLFFSIALDGNKMLDQRSTMLYTVRWRWIKKKTQLFKEIFMAIMFRCLSEI